MDIVTSELMFEQYSVPSLTYCIDSVMSFYQNYRTSPGPFTTDGLVISLNTASTSVIPILRGQGILSHAKRYAQSSFLWLLALSVFTKYTMGNATIYRIPAEVDSAEVSQFSNTSNDNTDRCELISAR